MKNGKLFARLFLPFYTNYKSLQKIKKNCDRSKNLGTDAMKYCVKWLRKFMAKQCLQKQSVAWHSKSFYILQANLTHLPRSEFVPGIGLGVGKCPYDPIDNSTAIYVEKGNPGGFPALVRDSKHFFLSCSNLASAFILHRCE